ncbi:MAG: hypothetical protein O2794_01470 [bacterium]|nr:hypothetical protein [bacterium]
MSSSLLFGTDTARKRVYLEGVLKELDTNLIKILGEEKPLGIDDVREIKRQASLDVGGSGAQAFVVWRADQMTPEAHEAFLKLLEEPPQGTHFFLCSDSAEFPDTILSRVIKIPFYGEQSLEGVDEVVSFFTDTIEKLKLDLEKSAQDGKVQKNILHKLHKCIRLMNLSYTARVSPKYLIDLYISTS